MLLAVLLLAAFATCVQGRELSHTRHGAKGVSEGNALLSLVEAFDSSSHKNCTATCNGEEASHQTGSLECWGDFKATCSHGHEDKRKEVVTACSGAFSCFRLGENGKDDADWLASVGLHSNTLGSSGPSKFTEGWVVMCEGNLMNINKVVKPLDKEKGHVAMVWGYACQGEMKSFTRSPEEGALEVYAGCKMNAARGSGGKVFDGSRSQHAAWGETEMAARAMAQKIGARRRTSGDGEGELIREHEAMHVNGADTTGGPGGYPGTSGIAAVAGAGHAGLEGGPPDCTVKCNGKEPRLWGYWPCKGELTVKCDGGHGDAEFCTEMSCRGVAIPALHSCWGTWTEHTDVAASGSTLLSDRDQSKDKDTFSMDFFEVTTGFSKAKFISKHGWHGMLQFRSGIETMHIFAEKGENTTEPSALGEDDFDAVELVDVRSAAQREIAALE